MGDSVLDHYHAAGLRSTRDVERGAQRVARPAVRGPPGPVHRLDEGRVALAKLRGGQGAAEEVEGELPRRQAPVGPAEVLPPRQRRTGSVLDASDLPVPFGLIDGERRVDAVTVRAGPW